MIKGLTNVQLVKAYKEAKKLFIKADLLGKEEVTTGNILDSFCNEIDKRNLDLREYIQ